MPHDSSDMFEADNATRPGRGPVDHPTMLGGCTRAASRAEAAFRVEYPNSLTRTSRIFALDARAAEAMYAITEDPWNNAHFLTVSAGPVGHHTAATDLPLSHPDGTRADLLDEVDGADVVVLLAASGDSEGAAGVIARECSSRGITCAGLALARGQIPAEIDRVVNAMRPFTRVLVVASDDDYIPAMLTGLRA